MLFRSTLDLSRLPPPELLRDVVYQSILSDRLARLKANLNAAGIAWDVDSLTANPLVLLEREDAYREFLLLQAINDVARARMLAFAAGADLEHIGANFGVVRQTGEDDSRLRRRIQLAPDAYTTAGSEAAYIYHALTADPRVVDAVAVGHGSHLVAPGEVIVSVLCEDGGDPDVQTEILANVRARLFDKRIKPLTVILRLQAATPLTYTISAVLKIRRGPDPQVVRAEALARLGAYLGNRRQVGRLHTRSGILAALHTASLETVDLQIPAADVDPGQVGIAVPTAINVTTEIVDG